MISVKIDGKNYEGFGNVNLNLTFDAVASTFSFDAYFDPDNDEHRKLFKPLGYKSVEIREDSTLLLTGVILASQFTASANSSQIPVSGYSKTGVLENCSIPAELYPLETNNKSLIEITERLIAPFGIGLVVNAEIADDAKKLYTSTTAPNADSVAGYLSELASQRNITLSHDAAGNLVLARPKKSKAAAATYIENMPAVTMALSVDGQSMHSSVTVIRQGAIDNDLNGEANRANPLISAYRPLVKEQTKGGNGDTDKATDNALASELSAITLTITSDRWQWFDGRKLVIIQPNSYISVMAKSLFLSKKSTWFVRAVTLTESASGRSAVLDCVLPEAINGEEPINPFS